MKIRLRCQDIDEPPGMLLIDIEDELGQSLSLGRWKKEGDYQILELEINHAED
jgi:hypothetical protein